MRFERAKLVRRVGELHAERREQLAEITVREMGTPNEHALDEIDFCVDIYGYYADNGPDLMKAEPIELLAGEGTVAIHISLNQADGGGGNRTRVRSFAVPEDTTRDRVDRVRRPDRAIAATVRPCRSRCSDLASESSPLIRHRSLRWAGTLARLLTAEQRLDLFSVSD